VSDPDNTNPTGDPSGDRLGVLLDPFMEFFSNESLPEAISIRGLQALLDLRCQFLIFTIIKVEFKSDVFNKDYKDLINSLDVMLNLVYKSYVKSGDADLMISSLREAAAIIANSFEASGL